MRSQEQEQEIRGTGYEFGKRGFVTSNKHETACCCFLVQGKPSARQESC